MSDYERCSKIYHCDDHRQGLTVAQTELSFRLRTLASCLLGMLALGVLAQPDTTASCTHAEAHLTSVRFLGVHSLVRVRRETGKK
jgi:hypothetical protein